MTHKSEIVRTDICINPTVQIGKKGITLQQVEEIKKQLKTRQTVKIKFLKAFLSSEQGSRGKEAAAIELASQTDSKIVSLQGLVLTLHKPDQHDTKTHYKPAEYHSNRK